MVHITIAEKYCIEMPDNDGNEINPDIDNRLVKYANNMTRRGWKRWSDSDLLFAEAKTLNIHEFLMLMIGNNGSKYDGAIVQYYAPFVKIPIVHIYNITPVGLPNRSVKAKLDNNDVVITAAYEKTWKQWVGNSYSITEINGDAYFLSNSGNFGSKSLTDDELMIIYNTPNCTLTDKKPALI